ncbi:MAG TPA: DNA polymerase IV [Thermoanaerobaculia bacterium]|nr:DNA polymerase IV [Thermoanaerobaculia bacterium]
MSAASPRICCLDLDTFFVSVERVLDRSLEGRPVIVGGRPGERGVVTSCSYEVRPLGVRSGMSLVAAAKLAPHAVYLPTRLDTYEPYARAVREIARRYSPVVQVASIDELYMDFAGCERMYRRERARRGSAPEEPLSEQAVSDDLVILDVVRGMTATLRCELGLPASAGIAASRSMAKVASGLAKPAGVLLVAAGEEAATLAPLPVRRLPGIGPVAEAKLATLGLATLGEVAAAPLDALRGVFGSWAEQVRAGASGGGSADLSRDRPAFKEHDVEGEAAGSLSNERTFRRDVSDPAVIEARLASLCERVCWRVRQRGVEARTVTLKLRYADFETISRSRTIDPTSSELELFPVLRELYHAARGRRRTPIRLLGVALSNLGRFDGQLELFGGDRRRNEAVDAIRARFGYDAIGVASGRRLGRDRQL